MVRVSDGRVFEIRQAGGHDPVAERLAAIPEVLEVHTITGAGDMLCRVLALFIKEVPLRGRAPEAGETASQQPELVS